MPEITVIVPVYKTEKYLNRCVDSILAQTFQDFELILVDDGSPDNCPSICDRFAVQDSRVSVIHQENRGQAVARNRAMTQAKGEWICFVDSDDLIHPQMLEILFSVVTSWEVKIAVSGTYSNSNVPDSFYLPAGRCKIVRTVDEDCLLRLFDSNTGRYWTACSKLVHRSIVQQFPFPEGRIFEDNAVVFKWLLAAGTIADFDADLYFYCTEPESTVRSTFSIKKLDTLWALEQQIEEYEQLQYTKILGRICKTYISSGAILYRAVKYKLKDSVKAFHLKLRVYKVWSKYRRIIPLTSHEKLYFLSEISIVWRVIRKLLALLRK